MVVAVITIIRVSRKPGKVCATFFLAAAISFFWTVVFKESYFVALFAFCAFEFGLGVYWPAMAVLRGELVPNSLRASVTSVFRVPLNVLVVMLLTAAGRASERALLLCCRR